jgi:hypothetical protein
MVTRRMRWERQVSRIEEERNIYRDFVVNREGKRALGRAQNRWNDNIKKGIKEMGLEIVDFIHPSEDRESGGL